MRRSTRILAFGVLLLVNGFLAQRLMAEVQDPAGKKGHCVGFTSCQIPCDAAHHFCICDSTSECAVE